MTRRYEATTPLLSPCVTRRRLVLSATLATAMALLLPLTLPTDAHAAVSASASAPPPWQAELPQAQRLGEGEFRWFGFLLYRAALWSETRPFDSSRTFALVLTYQRNISRARLAQASIDEMRRMNGDQIDDATLAQWQALMQRSFIDVREGDQITGVYLPGHGCRFYSSDALLADISDQRFAHAFFAIWLDPRTRDTALRAQLLGQLPQ